MLKDGNLVRGVRPAVCDVDFRLIQGNAGSLTFEITLVKISYQQVVLFLGFYEFASLTCPNFSNHLYGVTTPFSGPASIPATPFELGTTSGTDTSGNNRDRHDSTDFHPLGSQEIDWDKHFDFGPDGEAENGPDEGITSGIDTSRNNRDRHDSIDFHPLGSQEIDWDEHFDFGPDGEAENGPDEEAENGPNIGTENDQEYPEVGPLFTEGEEQAELPVTESIALRSEITSWENHDMSPWHPMITRSKTRAAQKAPEIGQNGKGA
ncbi:hypothetical protein MMC19_002792 [Ptychographa xylographoides]|nr:hypothetical protein [Ptychographa xylographoides]